LSSVFGRFVLSVYKTARLNGVVRNTTSKPKAIDEVEIEMSSTMCITTCLFV
jgi:hypothetical protein